MADGGFDPCECIWNHEMAMRRLLSMLRNSQAYCNDEECLQELPGPRPGQSSWSENPMMTLMLGWIVVAAILFYFRPRQSSRTDEKASLRHGEGPSDDRNPPPATS